MKVVNIARCPVHGLHGCRDGRALHLLSDPENWMGDPEAYGAPLHGHNSPRTIAADALTAYDAALRAAQP